MQSLQWHRKQIVSVEAMSYCTKRGANFSQVFSKARTNTWKNKAAFFQECIMLPCFVHNEYYLIVVLKRCCIEETAQLWNCKLRAMNINTGLKSVAAKAATAATVPTPLHCCALVGDLYVMCLPGHPLCFLRIGTLPSWTSTIPWFRHKVLDQRPAPLILGFLLLTWSCGDTTTLQRSWSSGSDPTPCKCMVFPRWIETVPSMHTILYTCLCWSCVLLDGWGEFACCKLAL